MLAAALHCVCKCTRDTPATLPLSYGCSTATYGTSDDDHDDELRLEPLTINRAAGVWLRRCDCGRGGEFPPALPLLMVLRYFVWCLQHVCRAVAPSECLLGRSAGPVARMGRPTGILHPMSLQHACRLHARVHACVPAAPATAIARRNRAIVPAWPPPPSLSHRQPCVSNDTAGCGATCHEH